jgi:hypothetical protein
MANTEREIHNVIIAEITEFVLLILIRPFINQYKIKPETVNDTRTNRLCLKSFHTGETVYLSISILVKYKAA